MDVMAGNCESLDVARIWIFVIYFIEIVITIVINDDVKRVTERCKRDKKRRTGYLSSFFHSLYNINRSFRVPFYALILSATAFNSSWEGCCLCLKSISLSLEIGRRWMWAWGTSSPMTVTAILLQSIFVSSLRATFLANIIRSANSSSSKLKR